MVDSASWLVNLDSNARTSAVDGLIPVNGYSPSGRPPEEAAMLEKARAYGAHFVFFEASHGGRPPVAQAFVYISDGPAADPAFADLHKRLWSWGGVPLVYRRLPALIQLFRCAHKPDFVSSDGTIVCSPFKTLKIASAINSAEPYWDAERLHNGTLWDDPDVCNELLSSRKSAHKKLIDEIARLNADLDDQALLRRPIRRKLLILCLLIAYLEERGVLPPEYFAQFLPNASKFFHVLANGEALIELLASLEQRFNGHVFVLNPADRAGLKSNAQLARFAKFVEARTEPTGQLTLWQLYSFRDLPVELISHVYQIFVKDNDSSVYTPPFLVRLMLDEALSWDRLDKLSRNDEVILDPCCGSGVFLVEAYKRLILHWRSRNQWRRPAVSKLLALLSRVHGIDLEDGAVELAAFSLCLALCDALEPEQIRASFKLFPPLAGNTLHRSCFFAAKEEGLLKAKVGVIVGNPPFASNLSTPGAARSYKEYQQNHGQIPDNQLAYLFLHEAMNMIARGGVLCMLQQYGFLYNQQTVDFRRDFIDRWDVREILDFVSVRGLFQKGDADTKVVVVVATATRPPAERQILHATFRRSGRVDAEQGFDIDYYDLHWLPRELALTNDRVWRANLLGGGRVLAFLDRLRKFRTLGQFAQQNHWDTGEGFIEGRRAIDKRADHIIGKPLLPSEALTLDGINASAITTAPRKPIEGPRSASRFTPPMLLVREQMELPHAVWTDGYLTYKNQIVGFAASPTDFNRLLDVHRWLASEAPALRAFVAGVSVKLFTQKATTLSAIDILALPYPEAGTLDISANERIIIEDIVEYQRDLIRLGEKSKAMRTGARDALKDYCEVFLQQLNTVYKDRPLRALPPQEWPGVLCQPFVFGDGKVDWSGVNELRDKLARLIHARYGDTLHLARVARIYDGRFIFFLKPLQLRYWLRSIALRDADETMSDLRAQGF